MSPAWEFHEVTEKQGHHQEQNGPTSTSQAGLGDLIFQHFLDVLRVIGSGETPLDGVKLDNKFMIFQTCHTGGGTNEQGGGGVAPKEAKNQCTDKGSKNDPTMMRGRLP